MELDVTHMIEDSDEMPMLSGSRAELGDNAARITWSRSLQYATAHPLLSPDQIEEARDYFASYGAWDESELASMTVADIQGLVVQEVAHAIREMEHYDTTEEYQEAANKGHCSGNLYPVMEGDSNAGPCRWYFYFGS